MLLEGRSNRIGDAHKPRIAVVTPFLDPSYGTERIVNEWIKQLAGKFDIHVYSQEVRGSGDSDFVWHRISKLPGPHLLNYMWWFAANQVRRWIDRFFGGMHYDLILSPGINCFDADIISVHIVFAEYVERNRVSLRFAGHRLGEWPRLIHRRLYYRLIMSLEAWIYPRKRAALIPIAEKTATQLKRFYGCNDVCAVVYPGLDLARFNPAQRDRLRQTAREQMGFSFSSFILILIGNDWRNKGVPVLLKALAELDNTEIHLLVVSREDDTALREMACQHKLENRIHVVRPRTDVEFYYAAADAYVGPSLEDTFALPPQEAMACGLPIIVSRANGISEILSHGVDGMILENSSDTSALADMIRQLYADLALGARLGQNAARTAQNYSWERNGKELAAILHKVMQQRERIASNVVTKDSENGI